MTCRPLKRGSLFWCCCRCFCSSCQPYQTNDLNLSQVGWVLRIRVTRRQILFRKCFVSLLLLLLLLLLLSSWVEGWRAGGCLFAFPSVEILLYEKKHVYTRAGFNLGKSTHNGKRTQIDYVKFLDENLTPKQAPSLSPRIPFKLKPEDTFPWVVPVSSLARRCHHHHRFLLVFNFHIKRISQSFLHRN